MSRQMQIFISFISAMLLISKCWLVNYRIIFFIFELACGWFGCRKIYLFRNVDRRHVVVLGGNLLKLLNSCNVKGLQGCK